MSAPSLVVVIGKARHWNDVYAHTEQDQVSWYENDPATSVRIVTTAAPSPVSMVDVGAGHSRLVDRMLEAGWTDLTVLDVSDNVLAAVRERLGERSDEVSIIAADLLDWEPGRTFEIWHDRAVFHFLTSARDRATYVRTASRAVKSGGALVLGVFAQDGPAQCSGLRTARYHANDLASAFAEHFGLETAERELHVTPWGQTQAFTWVVLRRR